MQIGRSASSCTIVIALASSSGSSVSGTPMLMSRTSAPPSTCALTSRSIAEKSPARSCSWKIRRPVGLIRSPIRVKRVSWPMTCSRGGRAEDGPEGLGSHQADTFVRLASIRLLARFTVCEASAA